MTFFALLLSHLLGDFVFQPEALVNWKQRSWKGILAHVSIHLVMNLIFFAFFLQDIRVIGLLLGVVFLHFWIDYAKIALDKKSHWCVALFFLDQFCHISVLVAVTWLMQNIAMPFSASWNHFQGSKAAFLIFFILAILSTSCVEIVRFQFQRQRKPHGVLTMNVQEMIVRFVVMSVTFGTVFLLLNSIF